MSNTATKQEEAYQAGTRWIQESDRFEKIDFLTESASLEFRDTLLRELVTFMGEDDCDKFFKHIRRNWGILTPPELEIPN